MLIPVSLPRMSRGYSTSSTLSNIQGLIHHHQGDQSLVPCRGPNSSQRDQRGPERERERHDQRTSTGTSHNNICASSTP